MPQINALHVTRAVHRRMVDFALNDHYVRDSSLRQACDAVWSGSGESGGLGSDLWVEGAFPSKLDPNAIQHFANTGSLHPPLLDHLDARGVFPRGRHPFTHQAASILAGAAGYTAVEKPAVVVTAGTGAGKTESFLLPLLTDIFRQEPETGQGVSCIILYPMNALVNDQVDRLYTWLQGQDVATVFHFTSETPENRRIADGRGVPLWDSCRYRTRRQARGLESHTGQKIAPARRGPTPRVVITNYSMLEYMLCRPQDAVFFGRNLRTVVLDEAHLYTGNLAAEIALLLRRLYLKCGVTASDVVQFATSATIASSAGNAESELKGFASTLFGKPERLVHVIQGEPHQLNFETPFGSIPRPEDIIGHTWPTSPTLVSVGEETQFADCGTEELRLWAQALSCIAPPEHVRAIFADHQTQPVAPLLLRVLERSPAVVRLYAITWEKKRARIEDFAMALFGRASDAGIEATRILFQIAASARAAPTAYPLLPNRVHFLVRAPEGISLCFRPQLAPHDKVLVGEIGFAFSASAGAGDPSVVGASLSLARCRLSGEWFVAGVDDNGYLREVPVAITMHNEPQAAWLARLRFFSTKEVVGAQQFVFNPVDGSLGGVGSTGVPLWLVNECPATGLGLDRSIRFFGSQSGLQLALMAEAALMEMPSYAGEDSRWKPARGRRLLIFSDSRTEAARLGPRFTKQHEIQVFRSAIADTLASGDVGGPDMLMFLEQQATLFRKQVQVGKPGTAVLAQARRSLEDCEERIRQTRSGGAITVWETMIAENPRIFEILDLEFGLRHQAADWNQNSWEKNRAAVAGGLRQLLAREFMRRTQWPDVSLETAGLVEVVYPGLEQLALPDEIRAQLPAGELEEALASNWPAILAALMDTVRTDGAITLGSREADLAYEYGGSLVGRFLSERGRQQSIVIPMVSVTGRSTRHRFTVEVLKRAGANEAGIEAMAADVLSSAFRQLHGATALAWISREIRQVRGGAVEALQINFNHLALRVPLQLFRCVNTGQIWPRNILGVFPGVPRADLREVTPGDLDIDARVGRPRQEWLGGEVFKNGLWAEEHSAQLSPQENNRIQNLFKEGVRNILSSTTTLELGIDIGGLNGVLMGNIPPGKANYLQRAGRAGRRADGSSVVFGYARGTPYERNVFLRFGDYLNQSLRKPLVFLDRSEIALRHLSALLLGDFFQRIYRAGEATGAMDAFGTVGKFYRQPVVGYWERNVAKPPIAPCVPSWTLPAESWVPSAAGGLSLADLFICFLEDAKNSTSELNARARTLTAGTPVAQEVADRWSELIGSLVQRFREGLRQWLDDYTELRQRWERIESDGETVRPAANAIYHQMRTYYELTVIETLADSQFLPRYGFPIGLSRLRVAIPDARNVDRVREEDQFRLQRSSMLALREYVPGSEVLVGNRVVTSHGLLKHWTGNDVTNANMGLRGWFVRDLQSGQFRYSTVGVPDVPAHFNPLMVENGQMLFARHGFTSAAWDPPRFGSDSERVGTVACFTTAFTDDANVIERIPSFGGISDLDSAYRAGGEILLLNEGDAQCGFAVCLKCGYAESELVPNQQLRMQLPRGFEYHASLFSARDRGACWNADEAPVLRNQRLAARQVSNLLLFDLSRWLSNTTIAALNIAFTLGQALRLVGCKLLQIDSREVAVLDQFSSPAHPQGCALVLYDSVAGGSGHIREIMMFGREWLDATYRYLDVQTERGDYDDREAFRRLLTSDIVRANGDVPLRPRETHALLQTLLGQVAPPLPPANATATLDRKAMIDRARVRRAAT